MLSLEGWERHVMVNCSYAHNNSARQALRYLLLLHEQLWQLLHLHHANACAFVVQHHRAAEGGIHNINSPAYSLSQQTAVTSAELHLPIFNLLMTLLFC